MSPPISSAPDPSPPGFSPDSPPVPGSSGSAPETRAAARTILLTGVAGFIGMHTAWRLLDAGYRVVGVDNVDDYYPPELKEARLTWLKTHPGASALTVARVDLCDEAGIAAVFAAHPVEAVIHLAAQAGVRFSMTEPLRYARSNLVGTTVVLEACRHRKVRHLVYASSSSVYGDRANAPFRESDVVDSPASFYAATKRSNELMVQSYASLYRLRATGLRLFTVYGPWGRPDMAPWLFTERILRDQPIDVYGEGKPRRDFTYVSDAADNIVRLLDRPLVDDPGQVDHRVVNLGSDNPVPVSTLIEIIERETGCVARRRFKPLPPGDVGLTASDPTLLESLGGQRPQTTLAKGMGDFIQWYRAYPELVERIWQAREPARG